MICRDSGSGGEISCVIRKLACGEGIDERGFYEREEFLGHRYNLYAHISKWQVLLSFPTKLHLNQSENKGKNTRKAGTPH